MIDRIKAKKNLYLILYQTTKILVFINGTLITILTGSGAKIIVLTRSGGMPKIVIDTEHIVLIISV